MKTKLEVLFCLVFIGYGYIYSQEVQQKDQLVVYGRAELKAPADQASFDFSVVGFGPTLRDAVNNARKKMTDVTGKLLKFGLKESDISTSRFYSGENFGGKAFLSSNKDYKAYISAHAVIDSLELAEEVILGLSEMELETISSISYDLKNYEELKSKARVKAIDNAKIKAAQIAEQLSIKLDYVQYAEETENNVYPAIFNQGYPNPFNSSTQLMKEESSGGSGFSPQSLTIVSSLKIIYAIKK